MGDLPIVELGDKITLQRANHPVMDQMALEGQLGRFRMYKLWEKFFSCLFPDQLQKVPELNKINKFQANKFRFSIINFGRNCVILRSILIRSFSKNFRIILNKDIIFII